MVFQGPGPGSGPGIFHLLSSYTPHFYRLAPCPCPGPRIFDPSSTYKWKVRSNCDASESNVSAFTSWQYFNTLSSIRISSGDAELIDNLNIYPNPTRGLFNISFVSDDIVTLELLVLNASGKVIMIENKEMFVGEYTKQVDLSEYPKGIYMVQIRTNNSFITKRIVVQ